MLVFFIFFRTRIWMARLATAWARTTAPTWALRPAQPGTSGDPPPTSHNSSPTPPTTETSLLKEAPLSPPPLSPPLPERSSYSAHEMRNLSHEKDVILMTERLYVQQGKTFKHIRGGGGGSCCFQVKKKWPGQRISAHLGEEQQHCVLRVMLYCSSSSCLDL